MTTTDLAFVGMLGLLVVALFGLALVEASLLHVRRSAVVVDAQTGDRRSERLLGLVDDLPRVMNAVLLAVLLCQVTAATIAGVLARRWVGSAGVTVATLVVTIVLFVYGEAIPKTLAIRQPLRIARRLSGPIRSLTGILRPAVSALVWVADVQSPRTETDTSVGEKELRHLAREAASAGRIEASDAELVERSFAFGDLCVEQIMVARADVVAVSADTPVEEALRAAIAAGHRRLPVFEGGLENIVGFTRLRDLADAGSEDSAGIVAERIRPALSVRSTMLVIDVLRAMQSSTRHLAVVLDDADETEGILTIEDAVRELVGTIEHDA